MTKTKEWAQKLNGIEYPAYGIERQSKAIALDGQIVVYGLSDDLLEFNGVINDEASAWEGTRVKITNKPSLFDYDDNRETLEYNKNQIENMKTIIAEWCPKNKDGEIWASWEIKTDIPHETFDIMEDGELFCRGIVFDAREVSRESL